MRIYEEKVAFLKKCGLFKGLDASALARIVEAAGMAQKEKGEVFFCQGEKADQLFFLIEGKVKVTQLSPDGSQIVVRYAGPGELFGCVPLFGGIAYPASGTTAAVSKVFTWDRETIWKLMDLSPKIALNALQILGDELSELRQRYLELATERVEVRVSRALSRLSKKMKTSELLLSRQDLAELTGTTLYTVSRILNRWQKNGWIAAKRGSIQIKKSSKLFSVPEK